MTEGADVARVSWTTALEQGRVLASRCAEVCPTGKYVRYRRGQDRAARWALPVYAIAGETGQDVTTVSPAQLRYRLRDRDRYTMWLCARLQRMGHRVRNADAAAVTGDLDVDAALALLRVAKEASSPASDDPVALFWRAATVVTGGTSEMSDGTIVKDRPSCTMWWDRREMIEQLDAVLVLERGGWPAGTRVRTRGVPHFIASDGRLAGEVDVSGDRAVVDSPTWAFDHDRRTLGDGPPTGYRLRYRALATGLGLWESSGRVPGGHLVLDLDPFPGPTGLAGVVLPDSPVSTAHAPSAGQVGSEIPPGGSGRPDEDFEAALDVFTLIPEPETGVAGIDDTVRAAALRRLWNLRDRELAMAGDSKPRRVAERIAARAIVAPEDPPTARELDSLDRLTPPPPLASWCEPDRELVTGRRRAELLQWLPQVVHWCTAKQREALDGLNADSTLDDVRRLLADEGFVEVHDVHGNVDSGTGDVDLILLIANTGLLASLHAPDNGNGPRPECVRVAYNAAELDSELVILYGNSGVAFDGQRRRTNVVYGTIYVNTRYPHWPGGSLKVQLAVLRAFCRPVMPWYHPVSLHIGRDGTPAEDQLRVIDALPSEIHELFGPHLRPRDPAGSTER